MVIISGMFLLTMMIWIFLDIAMRTIFNSPIKGTLEVTGEFFMVFMVFLAISYTQKNGGHIKVNLLEERFTSSVRRIVNVITRVIAAFIFLLIGYFNFMEGLNYIDMNIQSRGVLNYPLSPSLFIISLGFFTLSIRLLIEALYNSYTDKDDINQVDLNDDAFK